MGAAAALASSRPPRSHGGTVSITASGADDRDIDRLAISVDGRPRCDVTPCEFPLESGTHELTAMADGYLPYEHVLAVGSGSVLAIDIKMRRSGPSGALGVPSD